ncbi:PREDICTED: uncharacterized protein LOC108358253 [Rhagoletis zephyria]|uniref:uncharacterized protein LOC108358253 n=1 Tax=Rhagoletis zephyria TaxID=28612 RepID=UPI0008119928|nr:PREDICTED: uncharacterized protein LOC108358253 [Rhagoletis zephyria]
MISRNFNEFENWGGKVDARKIVDLSEEQLDEEDLVNHSQNCFEPPVQHSTTHEEEVTHNNESLASLLFPTNFDSKPIEKLPTPTEEQLATPTEKQIYPYQGNNKQPEKKVRRKSRLSYLEKCPNFDDLKNSSSIGLPLIINGNLCKPFKFEDSILSVNNTCAFDSICQIQMECMSTSSAYRRIVEAQQIGMARLNSQILDKKAVLADHYRLRAEILLGTKLFQIQERLRYTKKLDAQINAIDLSQQLLINCPSFQQNATCLICEVKKTIIEPTLKINMKIIFKSGFQPSPLITRCMILL